MQVLAATSMSTIDRPLTKALRIRMIGATPTDDVRPYRGPSAVDMAHDVPTRYVGSLRGLSGGLVS